MFGLSGSQGQSCVSFLSEGVFLHLSQCKVLTLSQNKIPNITTGSFTGLKSLEVLDLHANLINFLPDGVFRHLIQCQEIYLEMNRISSITNATFTGLKSLEGLDLHGNLITFLPDGALRHLIQCQKIYLEMNRISSITSATFTGLKSLANCIWQVIWSLLYLREFSAMQPNVKSCSSTTTR